MQAGKVAEATRTAERAVAAVGVGGVEATLRELKHPRVVKKLPNTAMCLRPRASTTPVAAAAAAEVVGDAMAPIGAVAAMREEAVQPRPSEELALGSPLLFYTEVGVVAFDGLYARRYCQSDGFPRAVHDYDEYVP